MFLDCFAERFQKAGYPRYEADTVVQAADYSDAITYVSILSEDVDASRIAVWGTSYSGGVVLRVGAVDRRLKAVISQLYKLVYDDRATRVTGKKPGEIPVVDPMLFGTAALPTLESHKWYTEVGKKNAPSWVNSVTIQSIFNVWGNEPVSYAPLVSPTPLLMLVAEKDVLCGTDLQLEALQRAKEPKQLALLRDGTGHFDCY
ncbi:peptidase S15 [Geopyxis carbonaria]|nr:peptidase S15 [Geopyxis carbonaria]